MIKVYKLVTAFVCACSVVIVHGSIVVGLSGVHRHVRHFGLRVVPGVCAHDCVICAVILVCIDRGLTV